MFRRDNALFKVQDLKPSQGDNKKQTNKQTKVEATAKNSVSGRQQEGRQSRLQEPDHQVTNHPHSFPASRTIIDHHRLCFALITSIEDVFNSSQKAKTLII